MKNEGPYLLEWIAFHKLCGFDQVVVYDNESSDETTRLLQPLARAREISYHVVNDGMEIAPQSEAYERERRQRSNNAEWVMFADADEFVVLKRDPSMNVFLASFDPEVSQVCLNWRIFGSAGAVEKRDGLVIERFTRASTAAFSHNRHVKSITRRDRLVEARDPHVASFDRGIAVHDDGRPIEMEIRGIATRSSHERAVLHHYVLKSRKEFALKIARGRGTIPAGWPDKRRADPDDLWNSHDRNDEVDLSALANLEAVKVEIARLEAIVAAVDHGR